MTVNFTTWKGITDGQRYDIPDSVDYQVRVEDFDDPWPFNIGEIDMSVSGLSASTFDNDEDSVAGDGTDDYGQADGPQNLPENESFGVAFTFEASSLESGEFYWGSVGTGNEYFRCDTAERQSNPGNIEIEIRDGGGDLLAVQTDNTYDDGNPHLVVINKTGDSASDIDFYIDDMDNPVATSTTHDQNFDHADYNMDVATAFYAEDNSGSIGSHIEMDAGIFEFNSEPYSESDRTDILIRRPEV